MQTSNFIPMPDSHQLTSRDYNNSEKQIRKNKGIILFKYKAAQMKTKLAYCQLLESTRSCILTTAELISKISLNQL